MEVPRSSPEFGQVEYKLKALLRSTTLHVRRCYQLSDPARAYNFEHNCQDLLTIESWMNGGDIFDPTEVDEIQRIVPVTSYKSVWFPSGKPDLSGLGGAEFAFVLFKVAVGQSVYSEQAVDWVPEGFDSVCMEGKSRSGEAQYQYLVDDHSVQVVPLYYVHFSYDSRLEERTRKKPQCEECMKVDALYYSTLFQANLCEACSKKGHAGIELAKKHHLLPVSKSPVTLGPCHFHPLRVIEYYCPTCSVPVCVDCKMIGGHANGEQGNHKLVPAKEALEQCLESISKRDAVMQAQKATIHHQLGKIGARGESIAQNVENLKRIIQLRCDKAMQEVERLGQEKLTGLLADDIELRRQLSEIDSLQEFLEYQRTSFDGVQHLLVHWKTHDQLVRDMKGVQHKVEVDIKSDLKCKIMIEISPDD